LQNFYNYARETFLEDDANVKSANFGNHSFVTEGRLASIRSQLIGVKEEAAQLLAPLIDSLARNGYESNSRTTAAQLIDIYEAMEAASETIQSRCMTFSNESTGLGDADGSNNGTGKLYRLTKDHNNHDLEGGPFFGPKICECMEDRSTNAIAGREEWALGGYGLIPHDVLDSGETSQDLLTLYSHRALDGMIPNATFDNHSATVDSALTSADQLGTWSIGDYTKCQITQSEYYRRTDGQTYGNALRFTDNNTIYMFPADQGANIDKDYPVFVIVRYYRESSCDGTLSVTLGDSDVSVDLSTKSNEAWFDLPLGVADDYEGAWYDNFKDDYIGQGLRLLIQLASNTTGTLLIDEIIFAQPAFYAGDGLYYLMTAGATEFQTRDFFLFEDDATGNAGIMQFWLSHAFGRYFPHDATLGSEVLSETAFATHANWDVTGDFDDSGGNATYTHSTGSGTLTQESADFATSVTANKFYAFSYDVDTASSVPTVTLKKGLFRKDYTLDVSSTGTHTIYVQVADIVANRNFIIEAESDGACSFVLDDFTLKPVGSPTYSDIPT